MFTGHEWWAASGTTADTSARMTTAEPRMIFIVEALRGGF
jgi:hypothetical protein